jgi:ankyrin repeat protein
MELIRVGNLHGIKKMNSYKVINYNKIFEEKTPLTVACECGHFEIVKYFLQFKYQPSDLINDFDDPEQIEYHTNNITIDYNLCDHRKLSPLHAACKNGDIRIVQLLLEQPKINYNCSDYFGRTPLFIACVEGFLSIVQLLLTQTQINYNKTDHEGYTPLHIAVITKEHQIVQLLLTLPKIQYTMCTHHAVTPLFSACQCDNVQIIKMLLQKETIDTRAKIFYYMGERYHCSPLIESTKQNNLPVVKLLLDHRKKIIREILQASSCAKQKDSVHDPEQKESILYVLDINETDEKKKSALYYAASLGHYDLMRYLIMESPHVSLGLTNLPGKNMIKLYTSHNSINELIEAYNENPVKTKNIITREHYSKLIKSWRIIVKSFELI